MKHHQTRSPQGSGTLFLDGGGNGQETQDLDDAMYALQALRSALRNNPSAASADDKSSVATVA